MKPQPNRRGRSSSTIMAERDRHFGMRRGNVRPTAIGSFSGSRRSLLLLHNTNLPGRASECCFRPIGWQRLPSAHNAPQFPMKRSSNYFGPSSVPASALPTCYKNGELRPLADVIDQLPTTPSNSADRTADASTCRCSSHRTSARAAAAPPRACAARPHRRPGLWRGHRAALSAPPSCRPW
jgi:hypothetical protein